MWKSLGGKGIINPNGERRLWAIDCLEDLNDAIVLLDKALPYVEMHDLLGTGTRINPQEQKDWDELRAAIPAFMHRVGEPGWGGGADGYRSV